MEDNINQNTLNNKNKKKFSGKKFIISLILGIIVGFATYNITKNIIGNAIEDDIVNKNNYLAIEYGMSFSEVTSILGYGYEQGKETFGVRYNITYFTWYSSVNSDYIEIGIKYDADGYLSSYVFGEVSYKYQSGLF